jgi:hypothetical protein
MTPAQASGHPNFVTDHPVQGPTDEGLRAADCKWAQDRLPARPACVDCEGPIPMWTQSKGLLGEQVSIGGKGMRGLALGAVGDPEVWSKLSAEQQAWVADTFTRLNNRIYQTTNTMCSTWGPSIDRMSGCFQPWYNSMYVGSPGFVQLRTDGVFDQDTLNALKTTALIHAADFPTPFPDSSSSKGLSRGAMAGIAAGGAAVIGGIVYVATRSKKSARRRSK